MDAIFVFLPMACYNKHGYYVDLYANLRKQHYLPRCYTFSIVHSAWCVGMTVKVRESALCTENICNFHCTEQSKVSRDIKKKSQPPRGPKLQIQLYYCNADRTRYSDTSANEWPC